MELREIQSKITEKELQLRKYLNKYELPENNSEYWYETYLTNWGAFYHGAGGEFVAGFIKDVTHEVKQVISNTKWQGDESWWISLKQEYDTFFKYEWSIGNLQYSFENAYGSLGKKHNK